MSFADFRSRVLKSGAKPITTSVTDTKSLAEGIGMELKSMGRSEAEYDVMKNLEAKSASLMETKANELMHTTNTGFGAELVPTSVLMTDFIDQIPKSSPLMGFFQAGFHGKNLDKISEVPAIGEAPLHQLMPEQTDGALGFAQALGKLPTAKVTITQKERYFTIDISEYELRFAVVDLVAIVKDRLAKSAANTMISDFLNGDVATAANTNINLIDGTPASTASYLGADGLRKTAFAQSNAFDVGVLDFADYITLLNALGNNGVTEDIAYIHSIGARNAALNVAEFKQAYINGVNSTALTGVVPNVMGANIYADRWLPASNATGRISGTPANNTRGSILAVHKTALQWGTNGDYNIEVYRVPGKGLQVIGYYFYGHAVASNLAGQDKTVALGYNIS